MVWVNVDIPCKTCTIHLETCRYVCWFVKGDTKPQFKGIEELKRDGGWFSFHSMEQAEDFCKRNWKPKGYSIRQDCYCIPSIS